MFAKDFYTGLILVLFFIALYLMSNVFDRYVFSRLNIDQDFILLLLWGLPFIAGCVAIFKTGVFGFVYCAFYVLIIGIAFSFSGFVLNKLGFPSDFSGTTGVLWLFKIFFFIGFIAVGSGAVIGGGAKINTKKIERQWSLGSLMPLGDRRCLKAYFKMSGRETADGWLHTIVY